MKAIGFLNFKTDGFISDNRSPLYFSVKSIWGFFTTETQRTPRRNLQAIYNESDRLYLKSNLIRAIAIYPKTGFVLPSQLGCRNSHRNPVSKSQARSLLQQNHFISFCCWGFFIRLWALFFSGYYSQQSANPQRHLVNYA